MINFDNVEDLVSYMFENVDNEDNYISVVTNKEMSIEIMRELLGYKDVVFNICEIDYNADYNKEYIVSLSYNGLSENWYISIVKCYLVEKEKYLSTGGYVLFHEDVNSKALIDMQNNEFVTLKNYDWFVIGEDIDEDSEDHTYMVNGNPVDKETFDKYISRFSDYVTSGETNSTNSKDFSISVKYNFDKSETLDFIEDIERRMMNIHDIFREINHFKRVFSW